MSYPVQHFQADGAKLVTHKPHELRITVLEENGNKQVYILPVKISETKIKRRSNQYRTMESVWPVPHDGPDHPQALDAVPLTDHLALRVENESKTARAGFLMWIQTKGGTSQGRTPQRYVLLRNHSRYTILSRDPASKVVHIDLKSRNGDVSVLPRWSPTEYALLPPSEEFNEPVKVRKSKNKNKKNKSPKAGKANKNKPSTKNTSPSSTAGTHFNASQKTSKANSEKHIPTSSQTNSNSLPVSSFNVGMNPDQFFLSSADITDKKGNSQNFSADPRTDSPPPRPMHMNTNIFASTSATSTTPTADFEIHTSTVDSMAIRSESAAMLPVTPQKPSRAALNNSSSIVLASPGHPLKLDLKLNRANNKVMNDSRLQPPSPRSRSSSIKRQRSRIFSSADTDAPGYTYDPYNQLSDFRASKRFRSNSMPMHTQPCQELNASIFLQGDLNHHNLSSTLSSSPSSSHSSSIRRSVSCDSGPAITFGMENRGRFHDLSSPFRSEYLHQHQFQHQHQRKTSSFNRSASDTSSIGSFDSTSDDDSNSSLCGRSSRAITPVSVSVPVSSPTPEFVHQQIELDVPSPPAKVRTSSSLSSMSPLSSIQETLPRVPDDNVMAADLFNEGASFFHPLPSIDLPLDSMASDSFDHLSSSFDFGIVDNISRDMNKEKEREKQCSQAPQMPVDDPFFDFLMPISSMSSYVPVV